MVPASKLVMASQSASAAVGGAHFNCTSDGTFKVAVSKLVCILGERMEVP